MKESLLETVLVPNKLIEAAQNLSLMGLRLRTVALSKLSLSDYGRGSAPPVSVSVHEWSYLFPDSEQPYRDLKRGLKSLLNAKVRFPQHEQAIRFLASGKYIEGEGRVELRFSRDFLIGCF